MLQVNKTLSHLFQRRMVPRGRVVKSEIGMPPRSLSLNTCVLTDNRVGPRRAFIVLRIQKIRQKITRNSPLLRVRPNNINARPSIRILHFRIIEHQRGNSDLLLRQLRGLQPSTCSPIKVNLSGDHLTLPIIILICQMGSSRLKKVVHQTIRGFHRRQASFMTSSKDITTHHNSRPRRTISSFSRKHLSRIMSITPLINIRLISRNRVHIRTIGNQALDQFHLGNKVYLQGVRNINRGLGPRVQARVPIILHRTLNITRGGSNLISDHNREVGLNTQLSIHRRTMGDSTQARRALSISSKSLSVSPPGPSTTIQYPSPARGHNRGPTLPQLGTCTLANRFTLHVLRTLSGPTSPNNRTLVGMMKTIFPQVRLRVIVLTKGNLFRPFANHGFAKGRLFSMIFNCFRMVSVQERWGHSTFPTPPTQTRTCTQKTWDPVPFPISTSPDQSTS